MKQMRIIQRARDYFYILRKGRKTKEVDQVRHLWTERGWDYYELQEKMLAERGNSYFSQDVLFNFIVKDEFNTILSISISLFNRLEQSKPNSSLEIIIPNAFT
jgi:hypothetical protein